MNSDIDGPMLLTCVVWPALTLALMFVLQLGVWVYQLLAWVL